LRFADAIRSRTESLLTTPGQELGRWARFARFQLHLWRFCMRRLWEHNVTAMSAALSFRTIFAMIPALVLALLALKSLGALEDGKRSLRRLLDESGMSQIAVVETAEGMQLDAEDRPQEVINVANEIEAMVATVESKLTFGRIGPVGLALLVWTAMTLLTTVERSLNRVFEAPAHRSIARRLPLYWSALTLGPLALIVAEYVGQAIVRTFEGMPAVSWMFTLTGRLEPVIVGILLIAAAYKLLPNTHIRYRAAIGGALVSVPLWLLAKWGFGLYVTRIVATGNLYGALGLLPLFLIWLNLSWSVFLFGAELAHTAANLGTIEGTVRDDDAQAGPSDCLAVAAAIAQTYEAGDGPVSTESVARRLRRPTGFAQTVLDHLESAGILCRSGDESESAYLLARPPERISILEVVGVDSSASQSQRFAHDYDPDVSVAVTRAWAQARSSFGAFTLADAIAATGQVDPAITGS